MRSGLWPVVCLLLCSLSAVPAHADADEEITGDWVKKSTDAHPCGQGEPPRGHFARDVSDNARRRPLTLTVRQDGQRLCYVVDGIAEAPVIHVRQGETLTIVLRNEITDPAALAGIVPIGRLEQATPPIARAAGFASVIPGVRHVPTGVTNLHVHGFAVAPVVPQDEVMMTCADPAVGPTTCGKREITYRYAVPTDMPAGLYWYHPHVHGEVQAQMLAGLSGAIVVEGPDDTARAAAEIPDRVFVVRQTPDNDTIKPVAGTIGTPVTLTVTPSDGKAGQAQAHGMRIDTRHELGCTDKPPIDELTLNGSPVINGAARDQDLAPLQIEQGKTEYWRVLNAATDAFLDLALVDQDGKPLPIRVVARDGQRQIDDAGNPLDLAATTEAQLVPPAGRLEFLVTAPPLGRSAYFISHVVNTGCAGDKVPERRLALLTTVAIVGGSDTIEATDLDRSSVPDMFSGLLAARTERVRTIAFAEYPRPGVDDQTDFYIAERRPGMVLRPFTMSDPPIISVPADAVEEWVVENWTNEIHAFHIHQLHFRVLAINDHDLPDKPLLDTITVPAAQAGDGAPDITAAASVLPGKVRIKLRFPAELAGDIPFHCHLVDHEDNGMMGVVRVVSSAAGMLAVKKAELTGSSLLTHPPICRVGAEPQR